ncbi:WXG100 family type VII secretion target [Nocardia sp. NEAU-G5]|uniref:ESAT-6-like protein n=1 Tax=Nocardia albiluteola TaxID=2842303 RepID=A0ABS6B3P2_9NOCA|nr:WXG100 family type VII secretion target [Nocardia albiluteola]MBU3064923.1 WXG100 family type VII secretion target [Nocardia albiluteola]
MDGDMMQYSPATINGLSGDLQTHHGHLQEAHDGANEAYAKIMGVWDGEGAQAFAGSFAKYKQAHQSVLDVLKKGIEGVEQAHAAAMSADGKVSDMFDGRHHRLP